MDTNDSNEGKHYRCRHCSQKRLLKRVGIAAAIVGALVVGYSLRNEPLPVEDEKPAEDAI